LFCRNAQNFETYLGALKTSKKGGSLTPMESCVKTINESYLELLKTLPKEHLFTDRNPILVEHTSNKAFTYNP